MEVNRLQQSQYAGRGSPAPTAHHPNPANDLAGRGSPAPTGHDPHRPSPSNGHRGLLLCFLPDTGGTHVHLCIALGSSCVVHPPAPRYRWDPCAPLHRLAQLVRPSWCRRPAATAPVSPPAGEDALPGACPTVHGDASPEAPQHSPWGRCARSSLSRHPWRPRPLPRRPPARTPRRELDPPVRAPCPELRLPSMAPPHRP